MSASGDRWARLSAALNAHSGADLTVKDMCEVCADVLLAAGAGIALMGGAQVPAATYSSQAGFSMLEEAQFTLGVGPAVDAYEQGTPVGEPDLTTSAPLRWTVFTGGAIEAGVRAVFSFPLQMGAAKIGTLTLYQNQVGPLDEDRLADCLVMAAIVTLEILAMQVGSSDGSLPGGLAEGGVHHAEVHQATGMVSAQLDIGVGEALVRLRARAFSEGTSVHLVAVEVIGRRLRFEQ